MIELGNPQLNIMMVKPYLKMILSLMVRSRLYGLKLMKSMVSICAMKGMMHTLLLA